VVHRILGLSSDYAFCLHSKERVPYHVILKVVFAQNPFPKQNNEKKLPLIPGIKQKQSPRQIEMSDMQVALVGDVTDQTPQRRSKLLLDSGNQVSSY
jgi:hypothetical protein